MKNLIILTFLTVMGISVFAQTESNKAAKDTANFPYWIKMMKDPNANFFETQKAFEKYWDNKEITRGCGYKPFKRWENFMKTRVDEFGNRPENTKSLKAYSELMKNTDRKRTYGNWELLGPIDLPTPESGQPNGLGRINVIAFHPTNENTIYIGAPSGGFWRSYNNGQTWETTTQRLPTLGVSAIAVNHKNPNIIYIGTGDCDADDAPGLGVYKSIDGGTTWEQKNNNMANATVNKLLIHPDYPETVLAATDKGVYKTTDGGETWELKTSGSINDMEFKPLNPDVVYAVKSSSLYKSSDNGESWSKLNDGLQTWSRAVIGVSPANPNYLYVLATNFRSFKALYFSDDEGESFNINSTTPNIMDRSWQGSGDGGQAWYDLCMTTDLANADIIYSGGINIFKSTDKGEGWHINAHWVGQGGAPAVHADHHDLAFNPLNNRLYSANDGGLYYTDNGGETWINISDGISISQIYKIGQSATIRDWVLAGNQDNGTSFYDEGDWSVIFGGDGMECLFDYEQEKYCYVSIYYGNIFRSNNGGEFSQVTNNISEEGAWVTPYVLNEDDPKVMYVGMKNIWKTNNARSYNVSWTKISSDIANSENMAVIENSPANTDILYIAREDKKVFRTTNANASSPTWDRLSNLPTILTTDIEAHPYDENIVYATVANSQVYKSTNMGASWFKITANLPRVSINTIVYDVTSNEGLYVGTDIGVFYKDATMTNWIYYSEGLPASAEVTELEIYYDNANPENNILRASTYGRGLWESALFSENITTANNARIIEILKPTTQFQPNDSIETEFTIKNIGSDVLNTLKVEYQVDNNTKDTTSFTLNLATYETAGLLLPKFTAAIGTHVIALHIIDANGSVISNNLSSKFSVAEANAIKLNLVTDSLASQTSWKIIDSEENTLYSSPTYINDSMYYVEDTFYLGTGCYKFIITDADGICCVKGDGSYIITNITTNQQLGSGAEFTVADTVSFCVDTLPAPAFKASKTRIEINDTIFFENQTVDNSYSYKWNFGEGAVPQTFEGVTPNEVYYTTQGNKTVVLQAITGDNTTIKTTQNYIQVYNEPIINTQPQSINICPSNTIELNVVAEGFELNYKWYYDGKEVFENTNGFFKIENAQNNTEGEYYCKVSNRYFTIFTDTVNVTLKDLPELTVTASDTAVCNGSEVTLTATGTGTFLWADGLGTNPVVTNTPSKSTTYRVSLTNDLGCANHKEVTVVVAYNPNITDHPENKKICEDQGVVILVNATGGALNYAWKIDDNIVYEGANVFYIDSVKPEHQGDIVCEVSNICGIEVSNSAYLTVDPLPIAGFSYERNDKTVQFINESQYANKYDWDFGDGFSSTQIEPSHTYDYGEYTVVQEVENDCGTDTLSYKISIITGVDDNLFAKEQLKLYPNPAQNTFQLKYVSEDYKGAVQVTIMNIEGKVIMQQVLNKSNETLLIPFNVSNYSKGLYQLHIVLGDRIISRKIVIN